MKNGKTTIYMQMLSAKLFFTLIFAVVLLLTGQATCYATTVTLKWDAVSDPELAGYKVYYQADSSVQPFSGIGAIQGASPVNANNQTTATIGGLDPAHDYYIAVTAYDTAGLESGYSNLIHVPELVSPTVAIDSPANNATVSGTVSITANASDNVGVTKVEFYVNGILQASDTSTPYLYSWNTSALAAGPYTLTSKAYDAAGNVGQSINVPVTLVKDTTAPAVTVTSPANNATLSGTVTITASASDSVGVSNVEFYEDGVLLSATNVAPYNFNWNTSTVANGNHTLLARAYDTSNNVGQSANVTVIVNNIDTTAPVVSVTAPANNSTINGTVSVAASASDNVGVSKVEIYLNGVLQTTSVLVPYGYNWNTTTMANGSYTLTAKAYDAANNIGQSSNVTVTVNNPDATAPIVAVTAPSNNATVGGSVAITATASDNVGVTRVRFYVNGSLKFTVTTAPYIFNWNTTSLANGTYTLYVKSNDAANNTTQSSTITVTVLNDTTAPVVSAFALPSTSISLAVAISSLSATDAVGVTGYLITESATVPAAGAAGWASSAPTSFTFSGAGSKTAYAWAKDAAGNVSSSRSAAVAITLPDTTAPAVTIKVRKSSAGVLSITATATDNVGVGKVEFYMNGVLSSTDTTSPYIFNWDTSAVANGNYILMAKAYDAAGNIAQSGNIVIKKPYVQFR